MIPSRLNEQKGPAESHIAFTASTTGVAALDQNFRYFAVNDAMASIDGRSASDHIGKSIEELFPDLWFHVAPILHNAMRDGTPFTGEVQSRLDGSENELRTWLLTVHKTIAEDTPMVIGLVDDITARKRVESAVLIDPSAVLLLANSRMVGGDPRLGELTAQELTILSLLGRGKTTKELAIELRRSE